MDNNTDLRPTKLADIIGMEDTRKRLRISIDAARARKEPLGHVLIDGSRGLGKTTLSLAIANEIGTELKIANAATIRSFKDLHQVFKDMAVGDVLFIDEIHALPKSVEEFLYPACEDFLLNAPMGQTRRLVSIEINPFTLIGATTHVGMVSAPLRDRFRFREQLQPYNNEQIAKIVAINAKKLGCQISADAALAISSRSRGTPRLSVNNLMWVRDFCQSKRNRNITLELTEAAMDEQGIDKLGLTVNDRKYLHVLYDLFSGGPTGVKALSNTLLIASETLEDDVEPWLLQTGLLIRTSAGRQLTTEGFRYTQGLVKNGYKPC